LGTDQARKEQPNEKGKNNPRSHYDAIRHPAGGVRDINHGQPGHLLRCRDYGGSRRGLLADCNREGVGMETHTINPLDGVEVDFVILPEFEFEFGDVRVNGQEISPLFADALVGAFEKFFIEKAMEKVRQIQAEYDLDRGEYLYDQA